MRELAARLNNRVPLSEALARFADDIDDPAADMVVAALSLNARQRVGGLERILSSLAASSRSELEMRRKGELERRALRRQAQRIAFAVVGFAALQAVFTPDGSSRTRPRSGNWFSRNCWRSSSELTSACARWRASEPEQRFLTSAAHVTEYAFYKPHLVMIGDWQYSAL